MSLSDAEKSAIVEGLYAASGAGDFDKAEEYLTDDFFITEADSLPYAGVFSGRTALRDLFAKVMSMMDVEGFDIEGQTVGGDYAIAILAFKFKDPSLKPARLCELFRFRGDKICEIRPYYFDPATIVAACKAKAAA
jgi:ketosteroid isomerase-like protein